MKYDLSFVKESERKKFQDSLQNNFFLDIPLSIKCYENAFIVPDQGNGVSGVMTQDFQFLSSSGLDGIEKWEYNGDSFKKSDTIVVFLGCFHWVWGHYLTDNIKRLWFLFSEEGKDILAKGAILSYTSIGNKEISQNGSLLMSYLGVNTSQLCRITQLTQFSKVFIPDSSIIPFLEKNNSLLYRKYTSHFKTTISLIKCVIPKTIVFRSVYFTRTGLKENYLREFGEWEIERVFKKKGFVIVHPEDYSLIDQLSILGNCESFATTEGSIAHNAIFCKRNTKVIIIRKADYLNTYQLMINDLADLDVTYIDSNRSCPPYGDNHVWYGPFFLCVTPYLKRWVNERILSFPYWMKPLYWWYIIHRKPLFRRYISNRKIVHSILKWYWNTLACD